MRAELPVCKRCCFCLPLRYGILAWGYVKLVTAVIISIALMVTLYNIIPMCVRANDSYDKIILNIVVLSILLLIFLIDIALNLVFIVGGHTKNPSLLRVYYIYNVVLWAITIALVLVMTLLTMSSFTNDLSYFRVWVMIIDFSSSFINIVMQSYFLLLIRSEIIKLRSNCEFRFVNNATEAECTMNYKEELLNEEKEMQGEKGTCEREDVCARTCQTNGTSQKNEDQD